MKEYVEKIIEIILEDMDCHHEQDHDEDGVHMSVVYSLNNEKSVIEKCLKALPAVLIERPKITEEFIEKKARKLHQEVYGSLNKCDFKCHMMKTFKKQICTLFEEE